MKKIFFLFFFCTLGLASFAQKETFDLLTYTPPKGWSRDVTDILTSFTIINKKNNSWSRINVLKATISNGSIEQDFETEWQNLIVKNYNPAEAPQLNEIQEADGWKIKTGAAKFTFNSSPATALLTTMSGFERCVSIVITTNSQDYIKDIEAFLASVNLIKPEVVPQQIPAANDDKNSIIGTWKKNGSVNPAYNDVYATSIAGYSSDQYTFNSNGTYYFVSKTFGMSQPKMFLVKESGTYQVSGNKITIIPGQSVIEAWSKKESIDNTGKLSSGDKWGNLLSSQKRTLEKITYQFTKHYFSGIQLWNLVLQSNTVTQRDGPHSTNTTFTNAWYYSPISANNPLIELPAGQKIITEEVKKEPAPQTAGANNTALLGTWCISASDQSNYRVQNGVVSTIFRQYTFNANGNYTCNIKTSDPLLNSILLGRESGTYQIAGTNLIINPQKSVLEEWSKKAGRDEWGSLLKTQNITPEKITYQFTKQYVSETNEWQLVLKANKETKRDGPFNNNERNAWIYIITSPSHPVIKLPN